jgi:hypothetical protein
VIEATLNKIAKSQRHDWKLCTRFKLETTSSLFLKQTNNMEIDFSGYDSFIAECYEAEDEFWKELFEDRVAEDAINEIKENF